MWKRSLVLPTLFVLAACATSDKSSGQFPSDSTEQSSTSPATAPKANEPLRQQLGRASERLHGKRFSGLLHFENESDEVFVSAGTAPRPLVKAGEAHTGKGGLLLAPGTQRLKVKLSSLLAGRDFPAGWTLLGLYVRSDDPVALALSLEEKGRSVTGRRVALPPGEWRAAMLDVSMLTAKPGEDLMLELRFDHPLGGNAWLDDVLLIDNRETLVDASPDGWTVRRAGLRITCERRLRFNFGVVTADGSPQGWEVEECNELRARFVSSGGEAKALTVYADGRSMWDGAYKPLSAGVRDDAAFAAAHASPADVSVPQTMGRIDRNTPGDADNDAYNERLGAYQVQASGGRIELTLTPRTTAVPRPVLQIAGLPQGKALITIEGRLVEKSTRLPDGQLLVELPARITRPTLVSIRIQ
jgi:hypothetical protein